MASSLLVIRSVSRIGTDALCRRSWQKRTMNQRQAAWPLLGCIAALSSCLWMDVADAAARTGLAEDLGHNDWEEVKTGYFIAAELIQQQDHLVVFDIFVDPWLQYGRFAGDCETMQIKQIRIGGISDSTVEFADISSETQVQDRPRGGAASCAFDSGLRAANLIR